MKRLAGIFILTRPEQRLVIFVVLLLVAFAWCKHRGDWQNTLPVPQTLGASPTPQGAAISKSPH